MPDGAWMANLAGFCCWKVVLGLLPAADELVIDMAEEGRAGSPGIGEVEPFSLELPTTDEGC